MRWFDRGNVCPPQRNPTRGDADGAFGVRRPAVGLAGVLFFQGPGRRRVLESPSPPFPGEGLVIACGKGFRMRFGKKGIGAVASITAAAALLTCLVPVALADNGGGGSGEGGGGDHGGPSQTADVHWIYKDSWPATLDGMKSALRDANVTLSSDLSDGANEYVDMNKTRRRSSEAHPPTPDGIGHRQQGNATSRTWGKPRR